MHVGYRKAINSSYDKGERGHEPTTVATYDADTNDVTHIKSFIDDTYLLIIT